MNKPPDIYDKDIFLMMLNQTNAHIYITDVETDKIVYMNSPMKRSFHLENPEGQICWQVLQTDMTGRCPFCRIKGLTAQEPGSLCVWEENNSITGRVYKNHDSLISWQDKVYHIQYSLDITEQVRFSLAANFDELTGTFNRRAGKEKLAERVQEARDGDEYLTVILYDVNNLKFVNDQYGHLEGDRLLRYIADVTKESLKTGDLIFRLSGDEFIIAFYRERAEKSGARIRKIAEKLNSNRLAENIFYEVSFSYGLVEVAPESGYDISDIIAIADAQMYFQKRDYHIKKSKEALLRGEAGHGFDLQYESDLIYKTIAASTDDYVFLGNMKTGVFQYPPHMVTEFGLPSNIVENAAAFWSTRIHKDDEHHFLESNQEVADGRIDGHDIKYRARNAAGDWIWLRCQGRLARDADGVPDLFAGIITNLGKYKP